MFRPICLLIGFVLSCLPVPDFPQQGDAPPAGRTALYLKYRPLLLEAALTAAACALTRLLFRDGGALTALWTGLGVLLARLIPLRKSPRDEDGTAAVWTAMLFFSPVWGVLGCAAGVGAAFLTGYELLAALLPAALFILPADLFYGPEAGLLTLSAAGLLTYRRRAGLARLIEGDGSGEDSSGGDSSS